MTKDRGAELMCLIKFMAPVWTKQAHSLARIQQHYTQFFNLDNPAKDLFELYERRFALHFSRSCDLN